jgi:hypothetical protein
MEAAMATDDTRGLALTLIEEQVGASIRRVMHEGRMHFSVIDVVGVLTDAAVPRTYWAILKKRLSDEEDAQQALSNCKLLRMRAALSGAPLGGRARAGVALEVPRLAGLLPQAQRQLSGAAPTRLRPALVSPPASPILVEIGTKWCIR